MRDKGACIITVLAGAGDGRGRAAAPETVLLRSISDVCAGGAEPANADPPG